MSARVREFFESLKESVLEVAPGLANLVPEVKAELSRLGTQGSMELASALFHGQSFVPYGPGQYTPTPEHSTGLDGSAADMEKSAPQPEQQHGKEMER